MLEYDIIQTILAEIVKIKAEVERIDQNYKRLQGLVNRKLGYENDNNRTETNKIDDGFDFLRKNGSF